MARTVMSALPTRRTSPEESRLLRTSLPLNSTPSRFAAMTSKADLFQLMRQSMGGTPSSSMHRSFDEWLPIEIGCDFESGSVLALPELYLICSSIITTQSEELAPVVARRIFCMPTS